MKLKYILIFLTVNAVLASILFIKFSFKSNEEKQTLTNNEQYKTAIINPKTDKIQAIAPAITSSNPSSTPIEVIKTTSAPICITLGPLGIDDKASVDVILSKNKTEASINVIKKPVYEIYWNLGNNSKNATSLFEKQKNGPMSDSKFVLIQDEENNWIVSIAEVYTSIETAKILAIQLAEKAQKINAGGKWQYRTKPDAYFYTFDDFSRLNTNTINSINVLFNTKKQPC